MVVANWFYVFALCVDIMGNMNQTDPNLQEGSSFAEELFNLESNLCKKNIIPSSCKYECIPFRKFSTHFSLRLQLSKLFIYSTLLSGLGES
jgi:hypothetical protein